MFLGRVSARETWKNRKIVDGREVSCNLTREKLGSGITRCMRQGSVKIPSWEEPNTELRTNLLICPKVSRDTLIAPRKK
jgi:hypothetical protein